MSPASSRKRSTKKRSKKPASIKTPCSNIKPLSASTEEALHSYFATLNGHRPGDLYQLVIGEVEKPLLKTVLDYTSGNQSQAAEILGINRGTLRKKLKHHSLTSE